MGLGPASPTDITGLDIMGSTWYLNFSWKSRLVYELLEVRSTHGIPSSFGIKEWMGSILVSWYLHCCVYLSALPPKTTFTLENMVHMVVCGTDFGKGLAVHRKGEGTTQWLPLGCKNIMDLLQIIDLIFSPELMYILVPCRIVTDCFLVLVIKHGSDSKVFEILRHFYVLLSPHSPTLVWLCLWCWLFGKLVQIPFAFDLMNGYIFWRNLISDPGWCIKRFLKCNFLWLLYKIVLLIIVKTVIIVFNECFQCARHCVNGHVHCLI